MDGEAPIGGLVLGYGVESRGDIRRWDREARRERDKRRRKLQDHEQPWGGMTKTKDDARKGGRN